MTRTKPWRQPGPLQPDKTRWLLIVFLPLNKRRSKCPETSNSRRHSDWVAMPLPFGGLQNPCRSEKYPLKICKRFRRSFQKKRRWQVKPPGQPGFSGKKSRYFPPQSKKEKEEEKKYRRKVRNEQETSTPESPETEKTGWRGFQKKGRVPPGKGLFSFPAENTENADKRSRRKSCRKEKQRKEEEWIERIIP
ncbi:MAG: hypothetical protein R6W75_11945 [Smithellaceae bacterium]